MSKLIVADISDAKSILQELRGLAPDLPNVPIQPMIVSLQCEPGMFDFYQKLPWVLPVCQYEDAREMIEKLQSRVIGPIEAYLAGQLR
ncbi:hypothetical protein SE92_12290 [Bradyrhizobium sp. AT1]|nr:hypothetical protein SE92_12290 [Bradyrhizobium sp. AT1]